jgi:hypothetical protein
VNKSRERSTLISYLRYLENSGYIKHDEGYIIILKLIPTGLMVKDVKGREMKDFIGEREFMI